MKTESGPMPADGDFGGGFSDMYADRHGSGHMQYEIFTDPEKRHDLYQIGRSLSDYVANNGVGAVCFIDRSARPAYVAMEEFWKLQYPGLPLPEIRFLNPKGFVAREDIESGNVSLTELLYNDRNKQGMEEDPSNIRPAADIVEELQEGLDRDMKGKKIPRERPILLFDACIHTGDSVWPIIDKFKKAGVEDVRFGVVSASNNRSEIQPDFVAIDGTPAAVCYPFANDRSTTKVYGSIAAEKNPSAMEASFSRQLRREISSVIHEFATR